MKGFILGLFLLMGCADMPYKPTFGQELCHIGCRAVGGKYVTMSEATRKCLCEFDMPGSLSQGMPSPRPAQGSESHYVQAYKDR